MRRITLPGIIIGSLFGIAVGIGAYTFIYAKGGSYLTNDPASCANCHVMQSQYDGWLKSSHRAAATCNDCHTPPGMIAKYATKASNGFWHSFAFTTGRFPEPLRIKPHNRRITNQACRKCHQELSENIEGPHASAKDQQISCLRCHGSVGHLR